MDSTELDRRRREISLIIDEIEVLERALGLGPQPERLEAHDIICRIERKVAVSRAQAAE